MKLSLGRRGWAYKADTPKNGKMKSKSLGARYIKERVIRRNIRQIIKPTARDTEKKYYI